VVIAAGMLTAAAAVVVVVFVAVFEIAVKVARLDTGPLVNAPLVVGLLAYPLLWARTTRRSCVR
jgi:hypothetical protein